MQPDVDAQIDRHCEMKARDGKSIFGKWRITGMES